MKVSASRQPAAMHFGLVTGPAVAIYALPPCPALSEY
jgi:hypothetical protein